MDNLPDPLLSVVIAIVSDNAQLGGDTSHLGGCLEALAQQVEPPSMEVIVPFLSSLQGFEELQRRFPGTIFIPSDELREVKGQSGSRALIDRLRARGMAAARGEIVALIEDVGQPDKHWSARVVESHKAAHAAVGGAVENGVDRPLNWAVYFCDFSKYLNPIPEGESAYASDANVSYKRPVLESIRPVWQDAFHETEVNWALAARGERLALSPAIIVFQHRGQLELRNVLKERFVWARYYGARRSTLLTPFRRMTYAALTPLLPPVLLIRMFLTVMGKDRCVGTFLRSLPITALLTLSWSFGELVGYVTGRVE